jgi:hypothetical protein
MVPAPGRAVCVLYYTLSRPRRHLHEVARTRSACRAHQKAARRGAGLKACRVEGVNGLVPRRHAVRFQVPGHNAREAHGDADEGPRFSFSSTAPAVHRRASRIRSKLRERVHSGTRSLTAVEPLHARCRRGTATDMCPRVCSHISTASWSRGNALQTSSRRAARPRPCLPPISASV